VYNRQFANSTRTTN